MRDAGLRSCRCVASPTDRSSAELLTPWGDTTDYLFRSEGRIEPNGQPCTGMKRYDSWDGGPVYRSRAAGRAPRSRHRPARDASDRERHRGGGCRAARARRTVFAVPHRVLSVWSLVSGWTMRCSSTGDMGHMAERGRTVYGLLVCSATTILVFGVLALSQIPVLRAIGLTTAVGSLVCLVFAALLAESPEKPPLLLSPRLPSTEQY